MSNKITQIQAEEICAKNGFVLLSQFEAAHKPIMVRCKCGKSFNTTSLSKIRYEHTKSCGHCKDPVVGDRFNSLVVIKVTTKRIGCDIICKCDCGREYTPYCTNYVQNGHAKTCGHCKDPVVGEVSNKLTVVKVYPSKYGGCSKVDVVCECGTRLTLDPGYFYTNKSCGHCNDPKVGEKYGSLTVIEITSVRGNGCRVNVKCDCGYERHNIIGTKLTLGYLRSCGNCNLYVNGIQTSRIALDIHEIVEGLLGKCEHNYKIEGKCFDIVNIQNKIIIEYDAYTWHRIKSDTTQKEKQDEQLAKKLGYKLLRIRGGKNDKPPTKQQLENVFNNHFQHGYSKWTITMRGWKEQQKQFGKVEI